MTRRFNATDTGKMTRASFSVQLIPQVIAPFNYVNSSDEIQAYLGFTRMEYIVWNPGKVADYLLADGLSRMPMQAWRAFAL